MLPSHTSKRIFTLPWNGKERAAHDAIPGVAALIILGLIRLYNIFVSPLFTGCCRYYPSCSLYMSEAVRTQGATRGVGMGLRRLARCHPFGGSGYDPVPGGDT